MCIYIYISYSVASPPPPPKVMRQTSTPPPLWLRSCVVVVEHGPEACAEFLSTPVAYGFSCFLQAAAVALLGLLLGHLKAPGAFVLG